MMLRTHLALIVLFVLLFLKHVSNQFLFIAVALIASFIPDIDTAFSKLGNFRVFRFLQFFVKHRGMFHSLSFAVVASIILSIFFPVVGLGFFLGYSVHILADSFTKVGVEPFWPWKVKSSGFIKTGSYFETLIFVGLVIVDLLVLIFIWFI